MSEFTQHSQSKCLIGRLHVAPYKNNPFALKLLAKLKATQESERAALLAKCISEQYAYRLFMETVISPPTLVFDEDEVVNIGYLHLHSVGAEHFQRLYLKVSHLSTQDRAARMLAMALDPSLYDPAGNSETDNRFSLNDSRAETLFLCLDKNNSKERIRTIFDSLVAESLRTSSDEKLDLGPLSVEARYINPTTDDGRLLSSAIHQDQVQATIEFLQSLNTEESSYVVPRTLITNLRDMQGLLFRKNQQVPDLFYEAPFSQFELYSMETDGLIPNGSVERLRAAFALKNNRLKDRIGASDVSILKFKKHPEEPISDVVTSLLLRAYIKYPSILTKTLPKHVDLDLLIQALGGSERTLGAYIGRAPLAAHRYLKKGQQPPQGLTLLLEILADFVMNNQLQEFVSNILEPEVKARGRTLNEIFGEIGWSFITQEEQDEDPDIEDLIEASSAPAVTQ